MSSISIILLAAMPSLMLAVLLYMISKILDIQNLSLMSQDEIKEIIVGTIFISLAFLIFNGLIDIASYYVISGFYPQGVSGITNYNFRNVSQSLIEKLFISFSEIETGLYNTQVKFENVVYATKSTSIIQSGKTDIFPNKELGKTLNFMLQHASASEVGFSGCRGLGILLSFLRTINNNIRLAYTGLWGHIILINLSDTIVIVFLSIGLFLRSFKVTRGIGGFLIAFAFALLLYQPISYLLHRFIIDYIQNEYNINILNIKHSDVEKDLERAGFYFTENEMYCNEKKVFSDVKNGLGKMKYISKEPNGNIIGVVTFTTLGILLSEGFAVLTIISISAGLSKLMGVEISPWVLSNIARLRL